MKTRGKSRRLNIGIRALDTLTQWLYRLSGGGLGGQQGRYPMLLLETVGRRTGKAHTHTLLYLRDGANMIICASNNGAPQHPAWYLNLQANPRVRIQAGRTRQEMLAQTASAEERERLWPMFLKLRPQTARYQAATSRAFPMVILKPLSDARSDNISGPIAN